MPEGGGLGSKIGSAFIEIGTSFVGFGDDLASEVASSLTSRAFVVGNALESFGQAVFARFSVPLLAATGANIAQFQALDREVRSVLTLFGTAPSLVEDTFGRMAETVREVSTEVGGLERDIAGGLYQAISAGVPEVEVGGFLEVAQAAAIADRTADLTTAVDGLSTVLNAYNLEASETERVSDALFQTVALGKTTFGELSNDIGRVAPLAANAGVEFEELFAIIGSLTLQGLSTSESISFLRAAITGTLRPTEDLNAIFQEIGFTSAEAAIPVLGLQGAFSTITSAAGGSTSKLQELIGTSEGVSAILGVTGDNAETFSRVLNGVENSAGAADRAFEIMDDSIGRTFGRLTESVDRLGNTFGELAAQFALPVLEAATGIINTITEDFGRLAPVASGLASIFAGLFSVFEIPILRDFVALLAEIGIAISGLIGGAGLLALTLGKVLIAGVNLRAVQAVLGGVRTLFFAVAEVGARAAGAIADSVQAAAGSATASQLGAASGLWGRLTTSITTFGGRVLLATALTGGLVVAIGAAVAGAGLFITKNKEAREAMDAFGKSSDLLAESLGLVSNEYGVFQDETGETVTSLTAFEKANFNLIRQIRNIRDTLGEAAAVELADALIVEKILQGNAPADLQFLRDSLAELSGLTGIINPESIETGAQAYQAIADGAVTLLENVREAGGQAFNETSAAARAFFQLFLASKETGNLEQFVEQFGDLRDNLDTNQLSRFAGEFNRLIGEEFDGTDITPLFNPQAIFDPDFLREVLEAEGLATEGDFSLEIPYELIPGTPTQTFRDFAVPEELTREGGPGIELIKFAEEYGLRIAEARKISAEGADEFERLAGATEDIFQNASESAAEAFATIRAGVLDQQPLLSVYEGAVDQTFAAWKAGQEEFREDLGLIDVARQNLVKQFGGDSALVNLFDAQPISEQAWLARLGETNFANAMEELRLSYETALSSGEIRVDQSADDILGGVISDIGIQYEELRLQSIAAGRNTAAAWEDNFASQAGSWLTTAQFYVDNVESILSGVDTSVPAFSGPPGNLPGFSPGGSGGITYNIWGDNVFENSGAPEDPEESAQRYHGVLESLSTSSGVVGS